MRASDLIGLALLLPMLGAAGIAITSCIHVNLRESVTMLTSVSLAWTIFGLLPDLIGGERPTLSLIQIIPGIEIAFKVEPLGMIFAALASCLWIVNSVYSIGYMRSNSEKHQTSFYIFFATSLAATIGIAFSANLFTLFLFYELLTLFTYPLVAHKGDKSTVRSARVYLWLLLTTSIGLLLPAIIWTYIVAGSGNFIEGGILKDKIEGPALSLLLALFVFGIGKAAVMPMHRWLPAAMVAPTPVSALLHAVTVVKAGVFSITKIIIYIFGVDHLFSTPSGNWLLYASAFTVIAASIVALRQHNIKRMLAYSTISQLSYVVLAVAILKPLASIGISIHIIAHAFGKITLFFAAGAIYTASKKTELPQLSGIGRRMPWTMAAFTVGALSMIGVPPTGGFVSKWYILAGAFESNNFIVICTIIASTALNAAYFLRIISTAWFGKEMAGTKEHGEAPLSMVMALSCTTALTILFFFLNSPVIQLGKQLLD